MTKSIKNISRYISLPRKTKPFLLVVITAIAGIYSTSPVFSQPTATQANSSVTNNYLTSHESEENLEQTILIAGGGAIALASLGLFVSFLSGKNRQQLETNLKSAENLLLSKKHQQLTGLKLPTRDRDDKAKNEDFQVVARDLIESYHTQALAQATSQYWFSVIAASFGFAIIMYAAVGALRSKEPQIALLNAIPGLAIEGVAVLFLTQADGTRKRATELYDRLRSDEKQLNAIALIESIQDGNLRDVVRAQFALQIVGIPSQTLNFNSHTSPHLPQNSQTPDLPEMTNQTIVKQEHVS